MARTGNVLNVAVFNCGYTIPIVQQERGQYCDIFRELLKPAVDIVARRNGVPAPQMTLQGYNSLKEEYPRSLDHVDAIIVSGSPNSAFEDLQWIKKLNTYLRDVYEEHPHIKLYGSCFGHQIICQALFHDRGVYVEKSPLGWELGVQWVQLANEFEKRFSSRLPSKALRLQMLHGDHVVSPTGAFPADISIIGSTNLCQNQGIYQPGRILTIQGHPEFDIWIEQKCLELVGERVGWESDFTRTAIVAADQVDDAQVAAEIIIGFFLE